MPVFGQTANYGTSFTGDSFATECGLIFAQALSLALDVDGALARTFPRFKVNGGFCEGKVLLRAACRQLGKWELGVQLTLNPPLRALTSAFRANPYESGHLG